jgi:hypothetical protein
MNVRNLLRANGSGKSDLGVDNLDDYAVGLVGWQVGQRIEIPLSLVAFRAATYCWALCFLGLRS